MSKTAQRKRSAYVNAYNVGRYGWPDGVKCYRTGTVAANKSWNKGFADGNRDKRDYERPTKTFWQALRYVFGW